MKRIALRWLGALLLSITLAAPALAAGKHLINGIDANYPPFAYVDETGKPAGFDVDSMNWIAKKMGFTVEHKPMDWDGIIPALLAKKIDMVCSGMSISPERKAQANFSDPYWTIRKIFITKKGSKVTEDQIYNGKIKLGVQRGTNEHEMLQKAQAEKKYNYQLRFYDSGPMAIEDLLNGRIDAIGLDAAPAEDAMRKGKPVQEVGVFGSDEFGVAIRKDDAETMKLVNEGYKLLKADPYWKELQAKYLGNKYGRSRRGPHGPRRFRRAYARPATRPLSAVAALLSGLPSSGRLAYARTLFAERARSSASAQTLRFRARKPFYGPCAERVSFERRYASKSIQPENTVFGGIHAVLRRAGHAFGVRAFPIWERFDPQPPFRESRCWK